MTDPVTGAAAIAATKAAEQAIARIGERLIQKTSKLGRALIDQLVVELRIGFKDYLSVSFNKCRFYKTILNPHVPSDVTEKYISTQIDHGKHTITDKELIQSLNSIRFCTVTGLAGSGKSMLMRYLTVQLFNAGDAYIPLFIELRNLNTFSSRDLMSFIRSSCSSKSNTVTEEQFQRALKTGVFVFLFDGFDEVNYEFRDEIQSQILQLRQDYPDNPLIVSSRPDDRFNAWAACHVLRVKPLTKKQCCDLLDILDYDKGVKRRFKREVNSRLYESHMSFLSSPLLTTIMLLTYEEFAEIPSKMNAFYSQAFDTLFQKHDATKEQYRRNIKTNLPRNEFKACFSAFCAFSYLESVHSFDDDSLTSTAERAITYMKSTNGDVFSKVSRDHLVDDLFSSVCMLQKDGLNTVFVHRSFQEFFTAVFVSNLHSSKVKLVLDRLSRRVSDSVMVMARELAQNTIEKEWVIPIIDEIIDDLDLFGLNHLGLLEKFQVLFTGIQIVRFPGEKKIFVAMIPTGHSAIFFRYASIVSLYPEYMRATQEVFNKVFLSGKTRILQIIELISKTSGSQFNKILPYIKENTGKEEYFTLDLDGDFEKFLEESGFLDWLSAIKSSFLQIREVIERRLSAQSDILDRLLD